MEESKKKPSLQGILDRKIDIANLTISVLDIIFVFCLFILSMMIRLKLYPIESADYFGFLKLWMDRIRELGGFGSLGEKISNYTSPYMYLMCLVSTLTENSLYGLKTISVLFDYVAAITVFFMVHHLTGSVKRSILGMSILLLCPTVILDSAYWCQCDIIYTTFILLGIYFFFKDKSGICFIFLGIAFSFKLQTLFILPFFIIMYLKGKTVKLYHLLYMPAIYVIMQFPAWMFGRSFKELMLVYFDQSSYYPWGTLEYPNMYAFLDEVVPNGHHMNEVSGAGTYLAIILLGFLAYYIYSKKFDMTEEIMVTIALFSVAMIVYTLPHMHDRYGFLIDLLAIVYAMQRPKKLPVMCGFFMVSVFTFMPYLIAVHIFTIQTVALIQLALITYVGMDLLNQIRSNSRF